MLERLKYAMQRFMMGRNGGDTLGWTVLMAAVVCSLLSAVDGLEALSLLAFAGMAYAIFRMYSRNVTRRRAENARFVGWFKTLKARFTDREHRYYRCPQCHQTVRVPRGKGKLNIRCPKCQTRFERKT